MAVVKRAWTGIVASIGLAGCAHVGGPPGGDVESALLAANASYDRALIDGDAAALDRLYAPDFVFVGDRAELRGKAAQIAHMTAGSIDLLDARSDEIAIARLGPDAALLTGRFRGRYRDGPREIGFVERYSSVWVRQTGTWRLRHEHSSFESATPAAAVTRAPLSPDARRTIDQLMRRELAARRLPGAALAVARGGELLYAQGYGLADVEHDGAVTADTRFRIASLTKLFTAVATMMLVEDGRLTLDTALRDALPSAAPAWGAVTVRQLLQHTGGVPSFTATDAPRCRPDRPESAYGPADVLQEVDCLPLEFPPGTAFGYSDTGYHLLGLVIERATGLGYEAFLRARILAPLGMDATRLMARPEHPDDRAVGYVWRGTRFERGPELYPLVEMSTGGLVSTVAELVRFDAALAGGRLVRSETLATMEAPAGIGSGSYGLGFASRPIDGRRQVGHTGGGPGAAREARRQSPRRHKP